MCPPRRKEGIFMKYLPLETASPGRPGYQQQVKEANIKRIFDLVRSGKCESRAQLVRAMQLSATSVSVLVEELTARGQFNFGRCLHYSRRVSSLYYMEELV